MDRSISQNCHNGGSIPFRSVARREDFLETRVVGLGNLSRRFTNPHAPSQNATPPDRKPFSVGR